METLFHIATEPQRICWVINTGIIVAIVNEELHTIIDAKTRYEFHEICMQFL